MNWALLKNSLLVGGGATLLAVSFGLVAALWVAGLPGRWRGLWVGSAIAGLALPPFLVTDCWLRFLGEAGSWRCWLSFDIASAGGAIWILSLLLWPITMLLVLSAWRRLEPAQLEADPAVAGRHLLRALLLPLARPALAQAALLTFVLALNNFAVPAILQVKVFPAEMWVRFNTAFDTVGALRLSWPLVLGPLVVLVWVMRRGLPWPHVQGAVPARLFRQQLGNPAFGLAGLGTTLLCALSVGLPLFQIISASRTWTELPGALAAGQSAVWTSLWLAATSALAVMTLGLALARNSKRNVSAGWLLWLPFLLPGVLLGIALIYAFNHDWSSALYKSAGIVVVAFTVRYLALGWTTSRHALQSADPDLANVACLDGANCWQMARHVYWPQISAQLAGGWYLVYLLCLWDVETLILVVPPGGETLALRVFNLLHYGHNAQVNALCLTLLALAVLPLLAAGAWRAIRAALPWRLAGLAAAIALALPWLAGCSPASATGDTPVDSALFSQVRVIGSRGVGVGQLNKPRSVAVGQHDNLYVVDMTGRVQKFDTNGVFLLSWQMPQTDKGRPKGMCRDRSGDIVVIEPHYSRLNHFSPAGKLVAQWGEHGTNNGQLTLPRAAAVDSENEIFISEYGVVERVQKFRLPAANTSAAAQPQLLLAFGHMGSAAGEFNRPEGLCVDAHDSLYVADSCNHRIQIFDRNGKFLRAYGKAGRGKGELSYPYDICVDAAGRQYVCEFGNSRIQVFDNRDQPLEIIGGHGSLPGQFNNPWGVALDSAGNLYVADSQNHRVQKLIRRPEGRGAVAAARVRHKA